MDVYLELGQKRVFAGALAWPGWCRAGRDEASARKALWAAGPRYARAMRAAGLGVAVPAAVEALVVVERLPGNATTDFGAPDAVPTADAEPVDAAALKQLEAVLQAGWRALDEAAAAAVGRPLRTGPRGGGRSVEVMRQHVREAEVGYLARIGWKAPAELSEADHRAQVLAALMAAAGNALPAAGPRGGKRWGLRTFVRRTVWHALDHAWEIEDRLA